MNKQRFTFGTVVGTDNFRCHPTFKAQFEDYLRNEKRVDPAQYEVITIASCTGHSFVYTREILDGESEDIEYLTPRSYARRKRSVKAVGSSVQKSFHTDFWRKNLPLL